MFESNESSFSICSRLFQLVNLFALCTWYESLDTPHSFHSQRITTEVLTRFSLLNLYLFFLSLFCRYLQNRNTKDCFSKNIGFVRKGRTKVIPYQGYSWKLPEIRDLLNKPPIISCHASFTSNTFSKARKYFHQKIL